MKNCIALILLCSLQGCVVMINENNYRGLKKSEKNYIRPFTAEPASKKVNNPDSPFIYEINSNDIKEYTRTHAFTWVHLWRPFCKAAYCRNINFFSDLAERHKASGLELLFVSESYDLKSIQNSVKNAGFHRPVLVLQDAYYGHGSRHNRVKLFKDLNEDNKINTKFGFDDYLFKGPKLVFMGDDLTARQFDSLMQHMNSH